MNAVFQAWRFIKKHPAVLRAILKMFFRFFSTALLALFFREAFMLEYIIVGAIVLIVAFLVGRSFYYTLSGKKGCACGEGDEHSAFSCGCGCSSCGDKYADMFKVQKPKDS